MIMINKRDVQCIYVVSKNLYLVVLAYIKGTARC